jgi:hypothetical protein
MKRFLLFLALLLAAMVLPKTDLALAKAHFTPGGSGYKLATLPPPGLYYLMYNVWYQADDYYGSSGNKIPGNTKVTVLSQTHRFVWTTNVKILGGDLLFDLLIPISYSDMGSTLTRGRESNNFGLGDISSHVTLTWHKPRYDFLISNCVFFPTGQYRQDEATSPGQGFWGIQPTIGLTWYFDEARTWTWSTVLRYEFSFKQRGTDKREGQILHMESSLGKSFGGFNLALSTAGSWQTTNTKTGTVIDPGKSSRFALGPEVGVALPQGFGNLSFRVLFDVHAKKTSKGIMSVLTWTQVIF